MPLMSQRRGAHWSRAEESGEGAWPSEQHEGWPKEYLAMFGAE
jgi:hypothetical protein